MRACNSRYSVSLANGSCGARERFAARPGPLGRPRSAVLNRPLCPTRGDVPQPKNLRPSATKKRGANRSSMPSSRPPRPTGFHSRTRRTSGALVAEIPCALLSGGRPGGSSTACPTAIHPVPRAKGAGQTTWPRRRPSCGSPSIIALDDGRRWWEGGARGRHMPDRRWAPRGNTAIGNSRTLRNRETDYEVMPYGSRASSFGEGGSG